MNASMATELVLVLNAQMMAVWRRRPRNRAMIHSDEGSLFGSDDFNRLVQEQLTRAQREPPGKLLG